MELSRKFNRDSNFSIVLSTWDLPLILVSILENKCASFVLNTITLTMSESAIHVMPCKDLIHTKCGFYDY